MSEAEEKKNKGAGGDESVPTASFSSSVVGPGSEIGPYKLLSILGEGGFAEVYLAEQQKPVKRRVALKVIKPGMDSKQVIARFEAERQALALLDHPNIAQVYDAGTTEAGRPYFVMERVKGVSLTEHCDRQKLGIEERLGLFLQVCEGVQHAHQKGIIHRDIKPSNILVSIEGEHALPKIIDFGVAKAITQPLTERTLFTEQGQLIGTPEYMSPEQAEMTAQDIDTRTDIYSLGVLLYELLTGALPFDRKTLEREGFAEIQRIIREEDPPRPSTRLTDLGEEATKVAKSRRTEVATLAKRLHKELEWIPLKAMRKERTHRYRTASDLADDIENYLNGTPLTAGPESAMYRIQKFVRRNRALVTGVAAVLVVLIAGVVVSTIFAIGQARARDEAETARDEAERQARISQAVADFLHLGLLASVEPDKVKTQDVTVRQVLDAASKNIEDQFKDAPLIEVAIRERLAETYLRLGKYKAAESHLERARQISREELGEEHPDTLKSIGNLARLHLSEARYKLRSGDYSEAVENATRACELTNWKNAAYVGTLAAAYAEVGDFDSAIKWQKKAIDLLTEEKRSTLQPSYEWRLKLYQSGKAYHKGIVGWWKFDGDATDSSGYGHDGKEIGNPTYAPGISGQALALRGDGDHVLVPDFGLYLNGLDALTVCLWVKSNVTGTDKGFIILEEPNSTDDRDMRYDAAPGPSRAGGGTNLIKCGVTSDADEGPGGWPGRQQLESSSNVQTTDWQHLAMTWSSGNQVALYINRKLDTPMWVGAAHSGTLTGYTKLIIGKGAKYGHPPTTDATGWDGLIDDVRIYNYALSEAEIKALYAGDGPGPTK